jgi:hypothetical protein
MANDVASTLLLKSYAALTVNRAGLAEQKNWLDPCPSFNKGGNRIKMTENKPKIKGKPMFPCRPTRNLGLTKKEFVTRVVGLETHTFNIGNAKYAAKYQKSVEVIANHVQKEYKGGTWDHEGNQRVELPRISIPNYPTASSGGTINPGDVFLWQQDIQEDRKRMSLLIKNKKQVCALGLGQCLAELDRKIKR